MSDLIDRQKAIDALGEEPPVWYDGEDEIAERNQWRRDKAAIESLPSAEPRWIPVSERLPELDDEVLVTDDRGELRHCIFCICGETWCGFITYEEGMRIKAVAWMPLPEPYKEVEE